MALLPSPALRKRKPMDHRAKIAMAMLRKAAQRGTAAPQNAELAKAMGLKSSSAGADIISYMEAKGLITVVRGNHSRIITITATGQQTAGRIPPIREAEAFRWTPARDAILMTAIANEMDFEQAGRLAGIDGKQAANRFDQLCHEMGDQAR